MLAGLQSIPKQLYEAAKVDGAGPWQRFWHVTIPGLKPVLRLHPPRKGYKTTKRTFPQGGALGYYGQEINTLLYKMR